jgi:zinc/manganese transport system substrate-binding protein
MMRRLVLALAVLVAALAPAGAQDKLKVVATFSILADLVKNVGGERLEIKTLVGPNADAHVYSPTPTDAKAIADAKLVFVNGLGYEGWITRLVQSAAGKAPIVVASEGVKPRRMGGADHDHGHDADPHTWQSVANAKIYVGNIRDALSATDPAGKDAYAANAGAYVAKLDAIEREIVEAVAKIPQAQRKIITTHDAFGYFQQAYGIAFVAPQGVSTESEASARDVAAIIRQVRQQKIPAVFLENVTDPRLVKRIAEETGAKVGGTLYSDALTDTSGPAPSYIELMRHNVKTLAAALGG